jgi:hypothetical protein
MILLYILYIESPRGWGSGISPAIDVLGTLFTWKLWTFWKLVSQQRQHAWLECESSFTAAGLWYWHFNTFYRHEELRYWHFFVVSACDVGTFSSQVAYDVGTFSSKRLWCWHFSSQRLWCWHFSSQRLWCWHFFVVSTYDVGTFSSQRLWCWHFFVSAPLILTLLHLHLQAQGIGTFSSQRSWYWHFYTFICKPIISTFSSQRLWCWHFFASAPYYHF